MAVVFVAHIAENRLDAADPAKAMATPGRWSILIVVARDRGDARDVVVAARQIDFLGSFRTAEAL